MVTFVECRKSNGNGADPANVLREQTSIEQSGDNRRRSIWSGRCIDHCESRSWTRASSKLRQALPGVSRTLCVRPPVRRQPLNTLYDRRTSTDATGGPRKRLLEGGHPSPTRSTTLPSSVYSETSRLSPMVVVCVTRPVVDVDYPLLGSNG